MASVSGSRPSSLNTLLFVSSFLLASLVLVSSEKLARPPIVKGLDWDFYWLSCPRVERIVRIHLEEVFEKDPGQAPGILRIFFHDCFANGCDGSVLLRGVNNQKDERNHTANAGFRDEALQTIENLRAVIRKQCPRVVTCADILVIAAREAVRQLGGPDFDVPLGRKDSFTFNMTGPNNLPAPFLRTDQLLGRFGEQNFDATDVVALSGAHTFGRAHCPTLFNRTTESDPPIDPEFKKELEAACPINAPEDAVINLDVRSPLRFDNLYYINLLARQGVFTSDQDIATHPQTKGIVDLFATDQKAFFDKFANAFVKVSQLNVLTGNQGEVRKNCFAANNANSDNIMSMVEEGEEMLQNL